MTETATRRGPRSTTEEAMSEAAAEKCDCCAQHRTCTERICDRCWRDECRDAQRERDSEKAAAVLNDRLAA